VEGPKSSLVPVLRHLAEMLIDADAVVDQRGDDFHADDDRPELLHPLFHDNTLPTGLNRLSFEGLCSYNGISGLPCCIGRSILERLGW